MGVLKAILLEKLSANLHGTCNDVEFSEDFLKEQSFESWKEAFTNLELKEKFCNMYRQTLDNKFDLVFSIACSLNSK